MASQPVGTEPWLATDADATTRWAASNADGQWWYVDLGTTQDFDQVAINWESGFARIYGVYVSDEVEWRTVFWTNSGDGGADVISFEPQTARYVMVYAARRGTALPVSFYGAGVFNTAAMTGTVQIAVADEDPIKPSDDTPPTAPEPPADPDKDPQLVGEGESAQENAPIASAALPITPTVAITVELPVAVILKADAKPIEDSVTDTLHLIGDASANEVRGRTVMTYEWSSHRDGVLSTTLTATLPITQLSPGPHIVSFRVQDDQGNWSQPVQAIWVQAPASFVYLPALRRE